MANLIKIDRNGSKHYEGYVPCQRCDGKGIYYVGVCNGALVPSHVDEGVCFKCGGSGKVYSKWIERTPEYEAKLEERRKAKHDKWLADHAEEIAEREAKERELAEAKRKEEEERERIRLEKIEAENARKAKSDYVGAEGDKVDCDMIFRFTAWFTAPSFKGYGETTMYIHTFSDLDGNTFVWKTANPIDRQIDERGHEWESPESGCLVHIKGTIKTHNEYNGEKQNVLTRCKVVWG